MLAWFEILILWLQCHSVLLTFLLQEACDMMSYNCVCLCHFQADLLTAVLLTLKHDKEEFVRRCAARVLCSWLQQPKMQSFFITAPAKGDGVSSKGHVHSSTCSEVKEPTNLVIRNGCETSETSSCKERSVIHVDGRLEICEGPAGVSGNTVDTQKCGALQCQVALVDSLNDFDWEVKVVMLDFWSKLVMLCAAMKSSATLPAILDCMLQSGCSARIAALTVDCDSAVSDSAIKLISQIHQTALDVHVHTTRLSTDSFAAHCDSDDVVFTSVASFLNWCSFKCHSQTSAQSFTSWPGMDPSVGFAPVPFLKDVLHLSEEQDTSDEKKVIVDCY